MSRALLLVMFVIFTISASSPPPVNDALIQDETLPLKLSEFHLLSGAQGLKPNPQLIAYSLRTPLFSDYAQKIRYVYIPSGKPINYSGDQVLAFPVGSVLIKSFGYPADMRRPGEDLHIIETRLLIHRESGWVALPYVWNADGSDADLKRAGTRMNIAWTHSDGAQRAISYSVPNVNQCKACHGLSGVMTPIGPKPRNLDDHFLKTAQISGLPKAQDHMPVWNDPATGSVEMRARAYLDVNCAHCHNRAGAASNSGLFLGWNEQMPVSYGVGKRPVAAGQGAGQMSFDIAAGHPEQSILLYRLGSIEPGIAMPELGRATAHVEGLALLKQWINAIPEKDAKR